MKVRVLLPLLAALLLAASCGSSSDDATAVDGDTATTAAAADDAATTDDEAETSDDEAVEDETGAEAATGDEVAAFPITIEHAFGETVIEAQPERIASVSWANHEVPLALGVVPVGMASVSWGDDDGDGVLPWVEDQLTALGADTPVLFDETDGIDFEAVADTAPDLILAAYSGLTQEDYDTLSQIAPVVAYPELAWATSYQEMIVLNATAMGMGAEGEALVADLESAAAAAFAAQPVLDGASVVFGFLDPNDLSQIGFYTTNDTRPSFLAELGMTTASVVADQSAGSDAFYLTVSAEQADLLADVDLFVTYGDDTTLAALQADPLVGSIPAIAAGHVAVLENSTPLAASANPSPLSIPWGIEDYVVLLAEAAGR